MVRHQPLILRTLVLVFLLFQLCAAAQTTGELPFTPAEIRSIAGKNVCDFQGEFPEQGGVYLDGKKSNAVHYQQRNSVIALFLLSRPTDRCGVIVAAVDLTSLVREGEAVEFKCYSAHEGGTTWAGWGHVIGLADNDSGRKRYVKARLAWRVNVERSRFESLTGQSVTCDTSGYAN